MLRAVLLHGSLNGRAARAIDVEDLATFYPFLLNHEAEVLGPAYQAVSAGVYYNRLVEATA